MITVAYQKVSDAHMVIHKSEAGGRYFPQLDMAFKDQILNLMKYRHTATTIFMIFKLFRSILKHCKVCLTGDVQFLFFFIEYYAGAQSNQMELLIYYIFIGHLLSMMTKT